MIHLISSAYWEALGFALSQVDPPKSLWRRRISTALGACFPWMLAIAAQFMKNVRDWKSCRSIIRRLYRVQAPSAYWDQYQSHFLSRWTIKSSENTFALPWAVQSLVFHKGHRHVVPSEEPLCLTWRELNFENA